MAEFTQRELYGGAMVVDLPKDYIDSSNLRQIPDHQEVFLSPSTLTSIIFEINEHVSYLTNDVAAARYHINDVVHPADRLLVENSISSPSSQPPQPDVQLIRLSQASVGGFPTSVLDATIQSHETIKHTGSNLPAEWQTPQLQETVTKILQLVVRLQEYTTDFCVRINVPLKELLTPEEKDTELSFARLMLEKIVESLDIKDFKLFG